MVILNIRLKREQERRKKEREEARKIREEQRKAEREERAVQKRVCFTHPCTHVFSIFFFFCLCIVHHFSDWNCSNRWPA
jgi:hypothetical protein